MKKILIPLVIIWLFIALGWYRRYSSTLNASKESAKNIENRAINEQAFLDERSKTDDAVQHRKNVEVMKDKQIWFAKDMEEMKDNLPTPIASWTFNKLDPIHFADGGIEIIQEGDDVFIMFSEDFNTPKAPDLYVVLSKNDSEEYSASTALNIWPLTSNKWKQIYKVTSDEFDSYNWSVKIWCRAFDVMFSVADLK